MRTLRRVGPAQKLWDVENVEAHVHTTLDAGLNMLGARLDATQHHRAFAFLWVKCWELSGLEDDGKSLRYVWEVQGFFAPRTPLEPIAPIKLQQFNHESSAEVALAMLADGRPLLLARTAKVRPRGAYDKRFGLSFSTYSRRVLVQRVTDWYRSDDDFGDTRYASNRGREISLEGLAEQRRHDDDAEGGFLDRHGPGSRLEHIDELNPHAYQELTEEVLIRAAVGL